MGQIGILALRGLAGGTLVVIFALVGEVVRPKAFSGLFSTAPSVATASLAITVVFGTIAKAGQGALGMVLGGVAMAACCLVAAAVIPRIRAVKGSLAAWLAWGIVAIGLYWAVFVGGV